MIFKAMILGLAVYSMMLIASSFSRGSAEFGVAKTLAVTIGFLAVLTAVGGVIIFLTTLF